MHLNPTWLAIIDTTVTDTLTDLRTKTAGHPSIAAELARVAVFVVDDAPADDPHLLGSYSGTSTIERVDDDAGNLPPTIEVYALPLIEYTTPDHACVLDPDPVVLRDEVIRTIHHEFAHHFGYDDDTLAVLGLA
jgi:predicted Zn-dependent protease with MMP-like domain